MNKKINKFIVFCVFQIQKLLLMLSYNVCKFFYGNSQREGMVVGLEEVASILFNMNRSLPNSVSVKINKNFYYDYKYNYDFSRKYLNFLKFLFLPLLLGYLSVRFKVFIFVGGEGFLVNKVDGRLFEFDFLKSKSCKVVCIFTGSEIRSVRLMNEYSKLNDIDVITTYQTFVSPGLLSNRSESRREKLAKSADVHADVIFNPKVDQISYISRDVLPFLYFYPDDRIKKINRKWKNIEKLKIVHAPSSPLIKGTPLVRAAIKQLKEEGYGFDYIELIGVENAKVHKILEQAHIVLNEFYAFMPGVLGIEAMASNAVLLTSADSNIEPTLFEGANDAWVVTPYWHVYKNLKEQLESDYENLKMQADNGTDWVKRYCSASFCCHYFKESIDD